MVNRSEFTPLIHRLAHNYRRLLGWEYFPITVLIMLNLIIGLNTNHYGMGWDDTSFLYQYGEGSLSAYRTLLIDHSSNYYCSYPNLILCYYGPAYAVIATVLAKALQDFNSTWLIPDIMHAMNFVVLNIGIFSLYVVSRFWMTKWVSFSIAVLFAAQPLLHGHGFINPKDIPFMVFFLTSVAVGLVMVEFFSRRFDGEGKRAVSYKKFLEDVLHDWRHIDSRRREIYLGWSVVFVTSILLILVLLPILKSVMSTVVEFLYHASPDTWTGALFSRIAPNASNVPLTSYIEKSMKILTRGIFFYVIVVTLLISGILFYWSKKPFSAMLSTFAIQTIDVLMTRQLWFAGIVLGFTSAIRVLGPFAGVIVLAYMLLRYRSKTLPLILPYIVTSFLFMYIFWPFLWKSPAVNFIESLKIASSFPWEQEVLFNGIFYQANNLPVTYLPALITIQITESVIILACVGSVYLLMRVRQKKYFLLLMIFAFWFIVPLAVVMIFRPVLYDNFRQFLFIVPPLFLIAGMGLELIFEHLKKKIFRVLFLAILIIPAIYINIKLYPFEYVYYNTFVGGTNGAFRKFEMDYWLTSYREAAEYLGQNEEDGAQVVNLPVEMSTFAENKLSFYEGKCTGQPLYAVISSRWNGDKTEYETIPVIHTVKRDDAVMLVIRELPCPPPPP